MNVQAAYKRIKAWWRMRQYVKELKSNTEPFRWGSHKKEYDKPHDEIAKINSPISCIAIRHSNEDNTKV